MTLPKLFDLSLRARSQQPALQWSGTEYTFGEIAAQAAHTAGWLLHMGIRCGDRICVYLPNSPAYISLFLAATRLGIIFVPVNILYRQHELRHILADAEPAAVITDRIHREHIPQGAPVHCIEEFASGEDAGGESNGIDGDTPAALVYTSGTTGASKGAILTHNNFAVNAANLVTCWQFTSADRLLLTLPLFHVHGLGNGLHCWLASGCHLRLEERFIHDQAAQWMLDYRPTVLFGVPTMYVRMLEWPLEVARRIGEQARLFVSGSAPLPAQVHEDFQAKFGHTILERYGMSETLMNLSNPYAGERRPGSVGFPLPGVSIRNLDAEGNAVADGETGELHLRGANLFAGYWRRPDATAAAYRDGWFRTGDLASRSPDGYYTLHGRRSDLIISGGFNIYPREIEEFLSALPGVSEVAVAAAADHRRGEIPIAYFAGDCLASSLEAACRASLASFKVPRAFVRMEKLPRTALGKIQKHLLPKWEPA